MMGSGKVRKAEGKEGGKEGAKEREKEREKKVGKVGTWRYRSLQCGSFFLLPHALETLWCSHRCSAACPSGSPPRRRFDYGSCLWGRYYWLTSGDSEKKQEK